MRIVSSKIHGLYGEKEKLRRTLDFLRFQRTRPPVINKAAMRSIILIVTFSDSRDEKYVAAMTWVRFCDEDDA